MQQLSYISFDSVPAPKGAAVHIEAFARALGRSFGAIELVTVSETIPAKPRFERWPGVFHTELPAAGVSLIDRAFCFRGFLEHWLAGRSLEVVQFRSIFEAYPLLLRLRPRPKLIFEVNGLPSIELKHRYPRVADDRELMRKLVGQERTCLDAADRIVTPSVVTARHLETDCGADPAKIHVIPNGVDITLFRYATRAVEDLNLLYFGTLSSWQGVDTAVRAVAQIGARLTILGVGSNRQRESLLSLAAKLAARVEVLPPVDEAQVIEYLHRSFAVLAPLSLDDRNTKQGCCPLKILEAMAAGVPVIASDLPVVRELGEPGRHFLLVKPGSVDQIAQAILQLQADPDLRDRLRTKARAHVEANYTWERAGAALSKVWSTCLSTPG